MSNLKIFLLFLLPLIIGCNSATATPSPTNTTGTLPYTSPAFPYPYPSSGQDPAVNTASNVTSYPYPGETETAPKGSATSSAPFIIPTPTSNLGIVIGQLLTEGQKEPLINALILADTVQANKEGMPPVIAYTEGVNPQAIQGADGRFYFDQVKPGTYALALWNPLVSTIIQDPKNTEQYLLIEVKAGQVTDIGTLYVK